LPLLCDLKLKGRIEVSRIEWIRGNLLRLILMLSIISIFLDYAEEDFPHSSSYTISEKMLYFIDEMSFVVQ